LNDLNPELHLIVLNVYFKFKYNWGTTNDGTV